MTEATARHPVVVVAGPTASGKSGLAVAIAEELDGVVINADSMQVYRDLHIVTARPGAADCARAPHRLYGVLDGADICSAGRWREMAEREIRAALANGRVPVVVGGTGLYLKALMEGFSEVPAVAPEVVSAVEDRVLRRGPEELHTDLAERDPVMAKRLRPSDRQRLVRAVSVLEATGRSLADWQADFVPAAPDLTFHTVLLMPPRPELYASCDMRFDAMVAAGAVDEVRALLNRGLPASCPVMRAIGVSELSAVIDGRMSMEDAKAKAQQATRNYAKRQCTWFRHQMIADQVLGAQFSESVSLEIFSKIRHFVLTRCS